MSDRAGIICEPHMVSVAKLGRRAENPRHLVVDKPPSKAAPNFKRKT